MCATLARRAAKRLPQIRLTLLIGQYVKRQYLGEANGDTLTATASAFADHLPQFLPIPHPSPRNRFWMTKNPWFQTELLPVLRRAVAAALK